MATASIPSALNSILLKIESASAELDISCTRMLQECDLIRTSSLMFVFDQISDSLEHRTLDSVSLEEALIYLRDARLCEVLLGLLRRWPWADMSQNRGIMFMALTLLPRLLCSLFCVLHVAKKVSRNHQQAAYAELSRRCVPQCAPTRTGCAGKLAWSVKGVAGT